jgi:hypothetical protein
MGSKLTSREREWAYKLEEALYNNDNDNDNGSKITSSNSRSSSSRFFRSSFRIGGSVNVSNNNNNNNNSIGPKTSSSKKASSSSSANASASAAILYGKPSDLEIAAHAIRSKGDILKSLKRIRRLKQFKDMYGIPDFTISGSSTSSGIIDESQSQDQEGDENEDEDDDNEDVTRILQIMKKVFFIAYPNFIQKIGIDKHNRVVIMFRLENLRWTECPPFNHNEQERFQALYYLMNCIQPTLDSIRMGTVWIGDLEDIELGSISSISTTTTTTGSTGTSVNIVRPTSDIYKGGRLLLRDSYPIKVDDICVIDCPSRLSKIYLCIYPFMSSHFVSKFVRVTPQLLQQHFSSELLSNRLNGIRSNSNSKKKKQYNGGRNKRNNNTNTNNNSEENDDWENLGDGSETNDDSNYEETNNDNEEDDKPTTVTINDNNNNDNNNANSNDNNNANDNDTNDNDNDNDNNNFNSFVVGSGDNNNNDNGNGNVDKDNDNDNNDDDDSLLWTTIERLVRIRFNTERNFRL